MAIIDAPDIDAQLNQARAQLDETRAAQFVRIRAEDVLLLKSIETVSASARNRLPGIVKALIHEGPIWRIELDCGIPLTALLTRQAVRS